jgi:putative transposase
MGDQVQEGTMFVKHQKGHVHKLLPSSSQAAKMACFAGMTRYVYNRCLALQRQQYEATGKMDRRFALQKLLPIWKKDDATFWLKEAPSQSLQCALENLENGWKRFFDPKLPDAEAPTFHKSRTHCSFRFPQGFEVDEEQKRIWLPKLGWMNYVGCREIVGTPRSITVRRECGIWYMSVLAEHSVAPPVIRRANWVGIDVGIACHTATSSGSMERAPKTLRRAAKRLARMQAHRDKKMQKGSKSYAKESFKMARLSQHIANIRKDHLHKLSTRLIKNHDVVCLEDLKVKNMSKSAKRTVEKPGKNVAAKSGLNREILSQGWFELRRQLTYKAAWTGGMVVAVDPRHTSQRCSACLAVDRKSRMSQARFVCTACGHEMHADTNAAKNILAAGLAVTALGALGNSQAVNSEECVAA